MKKSTLILYFVLQSVFVFSQKSSGIAGKILDSETQKPLQNAVVSVQNTNNTQLSDSKGEFAFSNLTAGKYLVLFKSVGYKDQMISIEITTENILDLGIILMSQDQSVEKQLSLIALTDTDLSDDNSGSENTSTLLQSTRDAFQQAAAFNWGQARFRIRGLDSEYANTMINSVVMNKIYDGRPQWSNWGGLNDVTRNQEFTTGTKASDYTFGGILGSQQINTRASVYRPGSRISASGSNTNYNWRLMGTYISGMNKKGWAYVISAGKRYAQEGYFDGTNYNANSFFGSFEKKISKEHSLNLTTVYTQNSSGKTAPQTEEVTNLTNIKYNSYWGWQENEKRNARVKQIEEPLIMLSHYWKINESNKLNTNVAYQFGKIGNSRIDYQKANSPDPTYYKNLPSYWTSLYASDDGEFSGQFTPNYVEAEASRIDFINNPQINWEAMYRANSTPITDSNNQIAGYIPAKSKYVLYEDRTDDQTFSFNSVLSSQLSENIGLNAGVTYRKIKSENFQLLIDLLGGTHFNDIDTFYSGEQSQSDLNNPNRNVIKGDKYGYNYVLFADVLDVFTQFKFSYKKVDFFLAQSFSSSIYQREGLYKNGLYSSNSFGKSNKSSFENFGFKGGITYKINGKQYFNFNAAHLTKAPTLRNTYPNARLNNNSVADLESESISSGDVSYIFRSSKFRARITFYFSDIKNATETYFYYAEGIFKDDGSNPVESNAFVSETIVNMNKRNLGTELGLEYPISSTLTILGALAFGQFTYNNNPTVLITNDALASIENSNPTKNFGEATLKNYKLSGTPQQAISLGAEYRDPNFWNIGINMNYLTGNYVSISAIRRTSQFYINPETGFPFPEATAERGKELLKQEKFNPLNLLNLTGGKSWRIKANTLGFFASINNLLNYSYKTGGYEQARNANFRQLNQDVSSETPAFGPKYFYGYGRTFFLNLYLNF